MIEKRGQRVVFLDEGTKASSQELYLRAHTCQLSVSQVRCCENLHPLPPFHLVVAIPVTYPNCPFRILYLMLLCFMFMIGIYNISTSACMMALNQPIRTPYSQTIQNKENIHTQQTCSPSCSPLFLHLLHHLTPLQHQFFDSCRFLIQLKLHRRRFTAG